MRMELALSQARSAVRWGRRKMVDIRLSARVKDVDAFLVSYPKSGRTWLRYLLSIYLAKLHTVPLSVDLKTTFRILPNFDLDPHRGLPAFIPPEIQPSLPLIAVSHRSFETRFFGRAPVIMLVRDPRDVCVSAFYHQTRHKKRFTGTIQQFIEDPQFGISSIIDYHNGWSERMAAASALTVSYEELRHDTPLAVTRVLQFLGIPVDRPLLDQAIAGAAFDRMKQAEKTQHIPGHSYDPGDDNSGRVRKGKVGGYDEDLSPDDVVRIAQIMSERLSPEAARLLAHSGYNA